MSVKCRSCDGSGYPGGLSSNGIRCKACGGGGKRPGAIDKLRASWSKKENDVMLHFPLGYQTRCDAHYLSGVFSKAFTEEMSSRGYDLTTIKFEISPTRGNTKFNSQRKDIR